VTVMDRQDELNAVDGPPIIDRHDCVTLDVNQDDNYLVQVDKSTSGSYCANDWVKPWNGAWPDDSFIPDVDEAADVLLIGSAPGLGFTEVEMEHAEPGCGSMVELFGNNRTMILAVTPVVAIASLDGSQRDARYIALSSVPVQLTVYPFLK